MERESQQERLKKGQQGLGILFGLALLVMLVSCVNDINDIGGGFDANQQIAGTFFLYLLVWLPCIAIAYGFLMLKLEKYFLSKEELNTLNVATQNSAMKELEKVFASYHGTIGKFLKRKNKS